ncbi:MAG: TonB-dependent receptor [Chitinophagaceae bacterium]|nr:TonB-dependent receptor [Chitinophagaceae bacterium]
MKNMYRLCFAVMLLLSQAAWSQTKEVSGKVTDSKDGSALPGVTIKQKGGTSNTVSLVDGTFKLSVSSSATTLIFSFVGYTDQEVPISSVMNVTLVPANKALSEVVVVGYGTKIKRDVTSSISKVGAKDFQNLPLPSFESALQGRAAGVFINQGSGKLGQGLNIRVRGISSISANQQPFIVIDGVPVVSQSLGSFTENDNPLATINPDDIESIEVLKDAASAAIYGARASNGVLLVTTKSGKVGKTKVNIGYFTGWSDPTKKQKFLNSAQYKELFSVAAEHSDFGALDPAEEFEFETGTTDWNSTNDVNWADQAFQKGSISQYSVSLAGGDAKTKFLVSGSWNDQKGIILSNRLDRANGRVNLDHTLNSRIRFGMNLSMTKSRNYRVSSDNAFTNPLQLNALPPLHPLRGTDGEYNSATLYYNNLIDQKGAFNVNTTYRSISNAYAELTITPDIMFRSQIGLDWNNLQEEQFLGKETLDGAPTGNSFNNQVTATIVTATNTLNFKKSIGDNHNIDGLLGTEFQTGNTSGASVTGIGFPSDRFSKIASAAIIQAGSSTETRFAFLSYFAKANYKFMDRYLLGASFRVDGSSRFGKDKRYGSFPAVSLGWIVSEENFLRNSKALSFLKLRGSYGRTGNAEIGNFSSLSLYSATAYADIAGLIATQIGVPDLSWEKTTQFDIGLDFGFFNNRLSGEVDYFSKKTNDLLLNVPLPSSNGFTSITKNIGDMENKGWELVLNGSILTGAFKWNASVNVSTYENKVTRLVIPVPPGTRTIGRLAVGQPFGQFYGKMYAGVDETNGDALYYQADKTTTNDYSLAVDTIVGNPNPDYYGGLNNHFSFKGFDLDVQCQFVKGGDIYNMAGFFQSVNGDYFDNQTVDQMNYWKNPGDKTDIPQPRLYSGNGAGKSSRWVQDGSYFRVKSVNLGYNFPRKLLSRYHIDNARVYVAGSNLVTLTKYKGYDPEVNSGFVGTLNLGHDFYTPPQARTISVGINLGF